MDTSTQEWAELWSWVGRQQAFTLIGNRCSAAVARALKDMKESRSFERTGLTWDQFCTEFLGLTRSTADRIIARYHEFGEAYFRLAEIARIPPDTYRQIAGEMIDDQCILIDGELVALTPDNGTRIRAAIARLRSSLRKAQADRESAAPPVHDLSLRLDALIRDCTALLKTPQSESVQKGLVKLSNEAIEKWTRLAKSLDKAA